MRADVTKAKLFGSMGLADGDRIPTNTGIEDNNFRRNTSFIHAVVQRVHELNNRVACFEVQRFPARSHDRQLAACQYARVYHGVRVHIESGSSRYAYSQNRDLGLTLRIGWQ